MNDEEYTDFEWACYDTAIQFLKDKKDCTRSSVYFTKQDMGREEIPKGQALKVTVEYIPLAEITAHSP